MTSDDVFEFVSNRHGFRCSREWRELALWSFTGFPCFWPRKYKTPYRALYKQLDEAIRAIKNHGPFDEMEVYEKGFSRIVLDRKQPTGAGEPTEDA